MPGYRSGRLTFRNGRLFILLVNGVPPQGAPQGAVESEVELPPPPLLRLWPDVGELLGLSKTLIYESAHRNELPIVRLGRLMMVPSAALEHMLRTGEQPSAASRRV